MLEYRKTFALLLSAAAVASLAAWAPQAPAAQQAPAAAAAPNEHCDPGEFCLFTQVDKGGLASDRISYDNDLHGTNVGYYAASWFNRTPYVWRVYTDTHCRGASTPLGPGDWDNVNSQWYGNIKSIAREDSDGASVRACHR
ncbi:peptidase inhibitor family I36 protein [Streptomyces adonidis]|uniref:peptidase inhibitor family I36 protein n=1 Tax=Streptomyces adonidis TaxID=3231367 RepID=UPI0034DB60AF